MQWERALVSFQSLVIDNPKTWYHSLKGSFSATCSSDTVQLQLQSRVRLEKRPKTPALTDALVTLIQLRCFSQRKITLHTKHSVCLPTRAHAHARPRSHCLVNTSENTRGQKEDVGCIIYTSRVYATSPGLHPLFVLRKYYCHFIWALYNINFCLR